MPSDAITLRAVDFSWSAEEALRPIAIKIWPADKSAGSDAVCYLYIEELLPRPVPVMGIDNMQAMELALALADSTLMSISPPARIKCRFSEGYVSTAKIKK